MKKDKKINYKRDNDNHLLPIFFFCNFPGILLKTSADLIVRNNSFFGMHALSTFSFIHIPTTHSYYYSYFFYKKVCCFLS